MTPGRAGDCVTGEEPWAWGIPFAQGERSPHLLRPLAANTTLSRGLVSDAGPCPRRVLPEGGEALRACGSPVPTMPPSFVQDILSNASNYLLRACAEPEVKIQQWEAALLWRNLTFFWGRQVTKGAEIHNMMSIHEVLWGQSRTVSKCSIFWFSFP